MKVIIALTYCFAGMKFQEKPQDSASTHQHAPQKYEAIGKLGQNDPRNLAVVSDCDVSKQEIKTALRGIAVAAAAIRLATARPQCRGSSRESSPTTELLGDMVLRHGMLWRLFLKRPGTCRMQLHAMCMYVGYMLEARVMKYGLPEFEAIRSGQAHAKVLSQQSTSQQQLASQVSSQLEASWGLA